MGRGQEEFPGGLKNWAKDRVSAMKVISESGFSERGFTSSSKRGENLVCREVPVTPRHSEAAVGFMRILSTPSVIHILIHKSLKCTQKPWTWKGRLNVPEAANITETERVGEKYVFCFLLVLVSGGLPGSPFHLLLTFFSWPCFSCPETVLFLSGPCLSFPAALSAARLRDRLLSLISFPCSVSRSPIAAPVHTMPVFPPVVVACLRLQSVV